MVVLRTTRTRTGARTGARTRTRITTLTRTRTRNRITTLTLTATTCAHHVHLRIDLITGDGVGHGIGQVSARAVPALPQRVRGGLELVEVLAPPVAHPMGNVGIVRRCGEQAAFTALVPLLGGVDGHVVPHLLEVGPGHEGVVAHGFPVLQRQHVHFVARLVEQASGFLVFPGHGERVPRQHTHTHTRAPGTQHHTTTPNTNDHTKAVGGRKKQKQTHNALEVAQVAQQKPHACTVHRECQERNACVRASTMRVYVVLSPPHTKLAHRKHGTTDGGCTLCQCDHLVAQ